MLQKHHDKEWLHDQKKSETVVKTWNVQQQEAEAVYIVIDIYLKDLRVSVMSKCT